MSEVPMVSERIFRGIAERFPKAVQVTSLEVLRAIPDQPALVVLTGAYHFGKKDGREIQLVLSPPAAAQLCRDLRQAVREHLLGE